MLTVVTYLWDDPTRDNRGYKCGPEHVRTLQHMIARNLTLDYRFVCVTDDTDQFYGYPFKVVELPMDKHVPGTVYARLIQHNEKWARENLGDRVLSLDVDVCITGKLDALASRTEPFIIWRNPNFPTPQRAFYQSSVQLFTPGARQCLYDDFDPEHTEWINEPFWFDGQWRQFGGREQAWISRRLPWTEPYFSDADGVYGAGRLSGSGVYSELPDNACIVSFPGARAPWQPEIQEKHPWLKEHYK